MSENQCFKALSCVWSRWPCRTGSSFLVIDIIPLRPIYLRSAPVESESLSLVTCLTFHELIGNTTSVTQHYSHTWREIYKCHDQMDTNVKTDKCCIKCLERVANLGNWLHLLTRAVFVMVCWRRLMDSFHYCSPWHFVMTLCRDTLS